MLFQSKMRNFNKSLLSLLLICITSCSQGKYHQETKVLNNYFLKVFNITIPEEEKYYILLPDMICKGCMSERLGELSNSFFCQMDISVIHVSMAEYFKNLSSHDCFSVLTDSTGILNKLNFPISNVTIVKTQNGSIIGIKNILTSDTASLQGIVQEMEKLSL